MDARIVTGFVQDTFLLDRVTDIFLLNMIILSTMVFIFIGLVATFAAVRKNGRAKFYGYGSNNGGELQYLL